MPIVISRTKEASVFKQYTNALVAGALALGLTACAQSDDDHGQLADLVVTDPSFTFATARNVSLELKVSGSATPQLVEVADAEGRRLMQGAFLEDTTLDLKVPVGQSPTLQVRTGAGAEATVQDVTIDGSGRAVTEIR